MTSHSVSDAEKLLEYWGAMVLENQHYFKSLQAL